MIRMISPSRARKNPETSPMKSPSATLTTAAPTPMKSDTRPPIITRENTSRPKASVPSRCTSLGPFSRWSASMASGS